MSSDDLAVHCIKIYIYEELMNLIRLSKYLFRIANRPQAKFF